MYAYSLYSLTGDGDEVSSTWNEVCESFDEMGLHENLLRGIYAYGKPNFFFDINRCWEYVLSSSNKTNLYN